MPDRSAVLELLSPTAFFQAIVIELGISDFQEIENACLMRVLAKPELGNQVILNEFALIMENFGVPLIDGTVMSDDDDFVAEGTEKPRGYNLNSIDQAGIEILTAVARYLLKEYLHPREFFGKLVRQNVEVKTSTKSYRVDQMKVKDFYLKIKIANIRKTLEENKSLNLELCLDPQTHPDVFNMKMFVRALEDIAEEEQEQILQQEQRQMSNMSGTTPISNVSAPQTPTSDNTASAD